MVTSPADVIWGSSRVPAPLTGMRDEPLITSAGKASIMGDSKIVNMVERATVNPCRKNVATSNVLQAGSPPVL